MGSHVSLLMQTYFRVLWCWKANVCIILGSTTGSCYQKNPKSSGRLQLCNWYPYILVDELMSTQTYRTVGFSSVPTLILFAIRDTTLEEGRKKRLGKIKGRVWKLVFLNIYLIINFQKNNVLWRFSSDHGSCAWWGLWSKCGGVVCYEKANL